MTKHCDALFLCYFSATVCSLFTLFPTMTRYLPLQCRIRKIFVPTLTMWERQVHWYGCNALSIRLVNHVASIPICPWYHLIVSFLVFCLLASPSGRESTSRSQPGSNSRLWSSWKECPGCSGWTGCNFCPDQFQTQSHWFSCSTRWDVNFWDMEDMSNNPRVEIDA